jgi:glycerophosphoryl diester phosphodiesterase
MQILTHRGLDVARDHYFTESSIEAFTDQLMRGYGLEFDIRLTKDKQLVVLHDSNLTRISHGKDTRNISDVTLDELVTGEFDGCHIASLSTLLTCIKENQKKGLFSALHLKHSCHNKETLDILLTQLQGIDPSSLIIFDVTIETAQYLRLKNNALNLAPSVAHPYDIERYNSVTGGTLLSIDQVTANKELFTWVWLDEWDTQDKDGGTKKFYTREVFDHIRSLGLNIALVTPELHATSPHLLGGESHADAATQETLFKRIDEILTLRPDALCTDYPDILQDKCVALL